MLFAHADPATTEAHLGHLVAGGLALLAAVVVAIVTVVRDGRRAPATRHQDEAGPVATRGITAAGWSAVAMAGSATVHGAVVREHFGEAALLGEFFLLLTVAQYGYALAVVIRPRARLIGIGLVVNLAVVVLWAYTRTVGIPFGIAGGGLEHVEVPDLMAAGFEIASATACALALRRGIRPATGRGSLNVGQQVAMACVVALSGAVLGTVVGS